MEVNPFEKKLTEKTLIENVENSPNINQETGGQKRALNEEEEEDSRPNKKLALEVKSN